MKHIGRIALLVLGCGLAGSLVACEQTPEGTFELHWSINGDSSAGTCSAAGVSHVRVLLDNTRADTDDDPLHPEWHYEDFLCSQFTGTMRIKEGLYRVRIVAIRDGVEVRSQVVELLDVQVIDGETTSVPVNPDREPPLDIEVPVCGDGVLQAGEWCDASDLGGNDCESTGGSGGTLLCAADCTFDTSGCTECGDGVIDPAEACDGSALDGQSCTSLGFDSGDLLCGGECAFDISGCVGCGNGVLEGTEQCDDGNADPSDGCSADCRLEQSALTIDWTLYENDGSTTTTCAAAGLSTVNVDVSVSGVGTLVHSGSVDCTDGQTVVPDLGYGLYTVSLSGRDASNMEQASGSSGVTDHTDPDGTAVSVDLLEL